MTLKKLFAGLISLAATLLAVCAITVCAGAETSGDYEYRVLDDGTVSITGYTGNAEELTIPSTIDGNKVTEIGYDAFKSCTSLISVVIPDGVTCIKSDSFRSCLSLTSISIPDSVTDIGGSAFWDCQSLTTINIPNSVTSISNYAFHRCSSLTSITIPGSVIDFGRWLFEDCSKLSSVTILDGVTRIGSYTFENCSSLTSLTIPKSVTTIEEGIVENCSNLTSITVDINNQNYSSKDGVLFNKDMTEIIICPEGKAGNYIIPDSVTKISDRAFCSCSKLTSINIPESVTSIGDNAFFFCSSLSSIDIPESVTSIGFLAFVGIPMFDNQTSTIKYIGNWAIVCDENAITATIKSGTVGIADEAFRDCSELTSVTIPDSVTSIGNAYIGCSNLTTVHIPDGLDSIKESTFFYCSSLNSIDIPDSVTSIGEYAFNFCSSLTSITIPDSVTSIEKYAFYNCPRIDDVYYSGTKAQWEKITFDYGNDNLLNATIHYNYGKVPAPSSVTGLKLKGRSGDALRLAWNKNTSADGYIIEMKSGNSWTRVGKITSNATGEFRKDKLKAGTAYSFRVKAYKMNGKTALYSGYTTISARTNPSAVTGLKLKGRAGDALRISWTKNTSADGYIIEMKSGSSWTRVGKITSNSTVEFKKSKLKAGTAYTFRVKAYKMSGKTALYGATKTISARTNPSAVSGLKLKASAKNAVRLSWTKNTSADGYIIEIKSGNTWTRVGKITNNSTVEFRKSKLKASTAYTFRVKAYKMSGKTALYGATKTITVKTK